jgi:hypothetical protein
LLGGKSLNLILDLGGRHLKIECRDLLFLHSSCAEKSFSK